MKYKKRKHSESKYVSFTDEKKQGRLKKNITLKRRIYASIFVTAFAVTVSYTQILPQNAVKSFFSHSSGGVFGALEKFVAKSVTYTEYAGKKISEFCFDYLQRDTKKAMDVFANKKTEAKSDANMADSSAKKQEHSNKTSEPVIKFAPINPCVGRISSPFGERVHPLDNTVDFHTGLDIAAQSGTEVRACFDGFVETSQYNEYSGNHVIIAHTQGYTSSYSHLSEFKVKKGDMVKKGDIIGYVGSTGRSTGPHLHFEIRQNKTPLNPEEMIVLSGGQ